jgi:hypothetical protein
MTKSGVIKTIERSNKKELGYTRETPAGLDHKKQGYTVADDNWAARLYFYFT